MGTRFGSTNSVQWGRMRLVSTWTLNSYDMYGMYGDYNGFRDMGTVCWRLAGGGPVPGERATRLAVGFIGDGANRAGVWFLFAKDNG